MDILVPEPVRKRTVVVYVPGGGFVVAAKESALNLRTYVAEAGFAVASVAVPYDARRRELSRRR